MSNEAAECKAERLGAKPHNAKLSHSGPAGGAVKHDEEQGGL